jgi:hypothetical protein
MQTHCAISVVFFPSLQDKQQNQHKADLAPGHFSYRRPDSCAGNMALELPGVANPAALRHKQGPFSAKMSSPHTHTVLPSTTVESTHNNDQAPSVLSCLLIHIQSEEDLHRSHFLLQLNVRCMELLCLLILRCSSLQGLWQNQHAACWSLGQSGSTQLLPHDTAHELLQIAGRWPFWTGL